MMVSFKGDVFMFDAEIIKDKIVLWIKNWFKENGDGCKAVVGISGGKDSSIVAALCKEALGKENVYGVLMPNGQQGDIDIARDLVKYLDIEYCILNIQDSYNGIIQEINKSGINISDQSKTNLQPRHRKSAL